MKRLVVLAASLVLLFLLVSLVRIIHYTHSVLDENDYLHDGINSCRQELKLVDFLSGRLLPNRELRHSGHFSLRPEHKAQIVLVLCKKRNCSSCLQDDVEMIEKLSLQADGCVDLICINFAYDETMVDHYFHLKPRSVRLIPGRMLPEFGVLVGNFVSMSDCLLLLVDAQYRIIKVASFNIGQNELVRETMTRYLELVDKW